MTLALGVVDVHAHALTSEFFEAHRLVRPEAAMRLAISDSEVMVHSASSVARGPFPLGFIDPSARVGEMDKMGIALQVLSSPPFAFLYEEPGDARAEVLRALNTSLVDWARSRPDRFRVLLSLPLPDVDLAVAEVARWKDDPAVAGIAMGTSVDGRDLDDEGFDPVWASLEAADLPVLIHPVDPPGHRLKRYFLRNIVGNPVETTIAAGFLIYGGVLQRHPGLRVCLVHGGGFLPYQLGRLEHGYAHRQEARRQLSRPPASFLGQLYFDSILHDAATLEFMVRRVGADRIVLGTDYPFEMGDLDPATTLRGLPTEFRAELSQANARRLLRLLP